MGSGNDILLKLRGDTAAEQIKLGKRLDARKFDEYRQIEITNDISKNADGSAKVKIGNTEVIAGIKMILGEPYPDSPDKGTIAVGSELLPLASPDFEVGPPREAAIELARVVDRGIRESKCIDFKDLCIREGEKVWIVFIDFYVTNNDGNLFDTAALACISSLLQTKIPKVEDDVIVKGEYTKSLKIARKPIMCTFAKVANKIVLDPSLFEEKAMTTRFSIATTEDEYFSAFQKGGNGTFTVKEIDYTLETAMKKAKEIRKKL